MIEGHGDDLYRFGDKVKYNFSTNIISGVDHTGLIRRLQSVMTKIGSYPEPAPFSLERKIADKIGVDAANVVVTNGATDAMYRIAHIFERRKSAIRIPTFREYQDACGAFQHDIIFVKDINEMSDDTDLIWLCNPNNPTGEVLSKYLILDLANSRKSRKDSWVVVDQAYADYTLKKVLTPQDAVNADNIVLMSSLTKRYAVPGLRIGYIVADEKIAAAIRSKGMPWAVNTLAIEAGRYLLDNDEDYTIDAAGLHSEALRIADALRGKGIECTRTDCNFILCCLPEGKASDLKSWLVENHGILIRDASNFESLDERYFRVAAQNKEQNDLLINAIKEWIS